MIRVVVANISEHLIIRNAYSYMRRPPIPRLYTWLRYRTSIKSSKNLSSILHNIMTVNESQLEIQSPLTNIKHRGVFNELATTNTKSQFNHW